MKEFLLAAAASAALLAAGPAMGQCAHGHGKTDGAARQSGGHASHGGAAKAKKAVNHTCPVGKDPIDGRTFVSHGEHEVGFCCPKCDTAFLGWEEERRDAFVVAAAFRQEGTPRAPDPHKAQDAPKDGPEDTWAGVYPLPTCPVSGRPLGSMGDPVVREYDGREVRFCCDGCPPRFEAKKDEYLKKIDAEIIKTQLPYYPATTCPVSGGRLGSMGEPDNYVHKNRLVRFCCAHCRDDFEKDPATHIAALDKAAADEQRDKYPLETCVVSGEPLDAMGGPVDVVVAGRLVRLCCDMCEADLRKDPAKALREIDNAWRKAGRPGMPEPAPENGR